jgi:hypothetical protein
MRSRDVRRQWLALRRRSAAKRSRETVLRDEVLRGRATAILARGGRDLVAARKE